MTKKLSPLWVHSPTGRVLHRKREYTKKGGRTLCGIRVGQGWMHVDKAGLYPKCRRCRA